MVDTPGPAYRTIGDVSAIVGVPQHVLRFWETHFPQITPLKRGGNRRYYRPADVDLLVRINRLLRADGYTIKGVQKLFAGEAAVAARRGAVASASPPAEATISAAGASASGGTNPVAPSGADPVAPSDPVQRAAPVPRVPVAALIAIRDRLAAALAEARAG